MKEKIIKTGNTVPTTSEWKLVLAPTLPVLNILRAGSGGSMEKFVIKVEHACDIRKKKNKKSTTTGLCLAAPRPIHQTIRPLAQ